MEIHVSQNYSTVLSRISGTNLSKAAGKYALLLPKQLWKSAFKAKWLDPVAQIPSPPQVVVVFP